MQMCDFNKDEITLLHGYSPVSCINIHRTLFLKTPLGDYFYVY